MIYEVIIIGGGPAGLMSANILSKHQINFLLLEKNERLGKKLLITGGRRSNVTNALPVSAFIDELDFKHKKFLYPTLTSFGPTQIISFFKEKGLTLKLEPPIKYFPETERAESVLDALLRDINNNQIKLKQSVIDIKKEDEIFFIKTRDFIYQSKKVIIATGSKSYPETGSNGDGLIFASHFEIPVKPFTPAETSVYGFLNQIPFGKLKGAQLSNVVLYINGKKTNFKDDLIFTHFGLSGPVIFKASHRIYTSLEKAQTYISFGLTNLNQQELERYFEDNKKEVKLVKTIISKLVPNQIAQYIIKITKNDDKPFNTLTKTEIYELIDILTDFKVEISRVESIKKAFVNAGGIDTKALNPSSYEVKEIKHLYFVGETVDIFGPIGGFNITMALSSGYTAAMHIVNNMI